MLDYQEGAFQYLYQHSGLDRPHAAMFLRDSVNLLLPAVRVQIAGLQ